MSTTVGAPQPSGGAIESAPERHSLSYMWAAQLVSEEAVRRSYQKLVSSEKYKIYSSSRAYLDAGMDKQFPSILLQLQPEADELLRVARTFSTFRSIHKAFRLTVALLSLAFIVVVVRHFSFGAPGGDAYVFAAAAGLLVPLIASFWVGISRRVKTLRDQRRIAVGVYSVKRRSLVQDSFTLVLNETLGPKKELPFPVVAPRLVELSASKVVSSSSSKLLKNFISGHESSAIGIAGPRGSGKSTMMRGLQADQSWNPFVVFLRSPVKYHSVDFLRRLHSRIAACVLEEGYGDELTALRQGRNGRGSRSFLSRLYFPILALGAGTVCVAADLLPDSTLPILNLGPLGLAGVLLLAYGFPAYVFELLASVKFVSSRRSSRRRPTSVRLAEEALIKLSFMSESNMKSKRAGKLFGGTFSVEDEDSVTLKDRDLSHADLVDDVQVLLRAVVLDQKDRPVIIVIDELDKMATSDELVATVNDLKDLFHIEGVHFVVSVSTDALQRFEQRGLSARDAFDSSFDTILKVKPLSVDESLNLVAARAEGFPPLVGAFCHAWSGGLPRDLLRTARRCVELQRAAQGELSTEVLVRKLLAEEISSMAEAVMKSPDTTENQRKYLSTVRKLANALEVGDVASHEPSAEMASIEAIRLVVTLANALTKYVSTSGTLKSGAWHEPSINKRVFEAAAIAMSSRTEPAEIRSEYFQSALSSLDAASNAS